jgi:hypothetical protein
VGIFIPTVKLQLAYGHVGGAFASYLEYSMTTFTDFQNYVQALRQHDWHYEFSDDHGVWKAGRANEIKLRAQANTNPVLLSAFTCWLHFINSDRNTVDCTRRDACIAQLSTEFISTTEEIA